MSGPHGARRGERLGQPHCPGRAQPAQPAVGGVQQQGRRGGLGAAGRQPRPHPHLQDPVQHLLHPRHLGDCHG